MNTIELFTTPLFHCNIDSTRELLPKLEEYALQQEKYKSGRNVSNVNGGHQTPFLSTSEVPLYDTLIDKLKDEIRSVVRQWNFDDRLQINVDSCWININRKGHLNMPHMHPNCDFAGIYYIKADEKTPIGFHNPDMIVRQEKFGNYVKKNAWSPPHFMSFPKDNDSIMFPGHIEHWVVPNWADTPRISLAFNIKIA